MGLIAGPFFILDRYKYNHEKGKEGMMDYMFVSSCIITFMNIGTFFLFKEKPKYPPSKAAVSDNKIKYDMKKDLN